jgi:hypothetical protein
VRASEVLAADVVAESGERLGPVRDLLLCRSDDRTLEVIGLVVGDGFAAASAHSWGLAAGRVRAPWPLAALGSSARRRARFIPAGRIIEWGPETVRISGGSADLAPLRGENTT